MDIDDIKAQLDRIFAAGARPSSREAAPGLRDAVVSFKVAIGEIGTALARSERELAVARQELADYSRRGELAAGIGDQETVRIAEEFTAQARARVDVLERKTLVQRDELDLAEREYEATRQRFQAASHGLPLDAIGGDATAPSEGPGQALRDQRAREEAVEAQLAHLKKKLGERK
jgi:hypothetical protein